jgi:tetratricopeptide (TPR) repeat protein
MVKHGTQVNDYLNPLLNPQLGMGLAEECLWDLECIRSRIIRDVRQLPASKGTLLRHLNELPENLLRDIGKGLSEHDAELLLSIKPSGKVIALIAGIDPVNVNSIGLAIRLSELMMEHGELGRAVELLRSKVNVAVGEDSLRLKALIELGEGLIDIKSSELEHERGNHEAEYRLIEDAMMHLSAAYNHYSELRELDDAVNVRLLGLMELARYHLTHGNLDEARSTYLQCASAARWVDGYLTEATRCAAMARLIEAIEDGEQDYYEEAGDMLLNVAQEIPEAAEEAEVAYGSALQLAINDDDKGRLFTKYLTALVLHVDWLVTQRYGDLNGLVNALRNLGSGGVASELGVDEGRVKLYLNVKALARTGGLDGVKVAAALAAMGLDLSLEPSELVRRLSEMGVRVNEDVVKGAREILRSWLTS